MPATQRSPSFFDTRLLGGLSPARFLAQYWQKRPLLIRDAIDRPADFPDRAQVIDLALQDDIESRLITRFRNKWTLQRGPIAAPRARRDWTLLVQGVNLHDGAADALMRRFDFVSAMRLDDLMISVAADGGGVGPHLDSYDVFLLQIEGRRRWRWTDRIALTSRERELVAGAPLKLLANFEPTNDAILEPGDMLYLPPTCAHDGVAIGDCTTASIGFRMPAWQELTQEFLFTMAEQTVAGEIHRDPGRRATAQPAALDAAHLRAITERMVGLRFTASDVTEFVGRYFTEPKAHVFFDPPRPVSLAAFARRAAVGTLTVDRRATMLYRARRLWIAGEGFAVPSHGASAFRRLADRRVLDAADAAMLLADPAALRLLHEWWSAGWLVVQRPTHDRRRKPGDADDDRT